MLATHLKILHNGKLVFRVERNLGEDQKVKVIPTLRGLIRLIR
jgi:hypothetical protein